MKTISFYTIGQAPHNTYTFESINKMYNVVVYYHDEKIRSYGWEKKEFYYLGNYRKNIFQYLFQALKSDLVILSAWQKKVYIILIPLFILLRIKFAIYLDLDIQSLKKYKLLKKTILKFTPVILITGVYGEKFFKRYLNKKQIYNFPYGVKKNNLITIENSTLNRINNLKNGDKINIFISNRFLPRKGYNLVQYLLYSLKEAGIINEFNFIIAGDGDMYNQVSKKIKDISDDVTFLGWIEYDMYKEYMLNCDIFLHCSEFEPYGIPPVDAYFCNKTIVATNRVYSIYDIQELGGKVYSFNYNKPIELFNIFSNLLAEKQNLYDPINMNKISSENDYPFEHIYMSSLSQILS
jgi:hypothetical protein